MPPSKKQQQESEDDYQSEEQSGEDEEKVVIKRPKVQRLDSMKNLKRIVINVSMTQYPVVIEVAQQLGWKIQYSSDGGDWDVFWTDWHIEPDVLIKMHLFQKISHYPGIHTLARKNLLGMNLMSMRSAFPQEYDFFPLTWMLPQDYVQFRTYFQSRPKGKARTYIVKPQADCQGRGIFLTRKIQSIENGKHYVVQRYLSRPYLIDGLKFDLRIYVLIGSVNPLRIYLFEDGLARFATEPYLQPTSSNLQKQYMHLTNYAINKKNPKFIFNNNASNMGIGHKRSLISVMKQLSQKGVDIAQLRRRISDLIIKTIITGLPIMSHQYKCSQPEDYTGNMCFHILGFDVMLKSNAEPIILEVNHTPSFTTDTPLDHKIKKALIKDTMKIMNVNVNKKTQLYNLCMQNNQSRLLTGKRNILQGAQREQLINKHEKQRQQYERSNLGGFEVIYPCDNQQRMRTYKQLIDHCTNQYFEQKNGTRMKIAEKQAKKLARQEYKELKMKQCKQRAQQKQKKKQRSRLNDSKVIRQSKQSTQQTSQTNLSKINATNKNTPTQITQMISSQPARNNEKRRTIDTSQISISLNSTERTRRQHDIINPKYSKQQRNVKTQSEKLTPEQKYNNQSAMRAAKLVMHQLSKASQKRIISTPTRHSALMDKISQLPAIIQPPTQLPLTLKSNLILGRDFDNHRRVLKATGNIQRQVIHRSISGKNYTKAISVGQQEKDETPKRTHLSTLMAKKRFEQKLHEKRKLEYKINSDTKRPVNNKLPYNVLGSSHQPTSLKDYQNSGQFVMPKIFCLNFQSQKILDSNMKFLLLKNIQTHDK